MYIPVRRITILTVPLEAGKVNYKFGPQNLLRGKRVRHIIPLTAGTTPTGETVAANAFFLNLKNTGNKSVLDNVASGLLAINTENLLDLEGLDIGWENSGIQVTGTVTAGQVIALQVFYE